MIHITEGHGKLKNIRSINTPTTTNPYCIKMQNTESVCAKCYAARYEKLRPSLVGAFTRNLVLSHRWLLEIEVPRLNDEIFRFHSYGELYNEQHLLNYILICMVNRSTTFALWTKRKEIIRSVFDKHPKPVNLILIYSSPTLDTISLRPKYFDKVFTAFTKGVTADINCHGACNECRLCYSLNDVKRINEVVK